jgi:hypothetical protein
VIDISIYTPAKAQLENNVQTSANSVKRKRLFRDDQEKSLT